MNIKTLVIGGGGFIGAHLVTKLLEAGRSVTVLGRSVAPHFLLPRPVNYYVGDFGDPSILDSLLAEHQEIIHLAYATVPNTSFDDPLRDLLDNLPSAVNLFSSAAQWGGRLVLVSSGGTVYGEANHTPITEEHSTNPISPYGVTKLMLEKYSQLYAKTRGLQVICVRPGNAYGVGQRPNIGQGFVSAAMALILKGLPVKVFGNRGTIRDYIYVSDLADGIVSALECGKSSEIYNIGSGIGRSNMDVIEAISSLPIEAGVRVRVEHAPSREFDVNVNILDSSKLKLHSGWEPKIDFHEGLLKTFEWLKD
jgi:UDP-glucose 4-epimerase